MDAAVIRIARRDPATGTWRVQSTDFTRSGSVRLAFDPAGGAHLALASHVDATNLTTRHAYLPPCP